MGDHLRKRRLDLGLLQREVADLLGVDRGMVCSWERNRRAPALWNLPAVISFLGCSPFPAARSLAERLKAYRQVLGLSQEKLARILGVDESTLWKWEKAKSKPNREHELTVEAFLASERRILKTAVVPPARALMTVRTPQFSTTLSASAQAPGTATPANRPTTSPPTTTPSQR